MTCYDFINTMKLFIGLLTVFLPQVSWASLVVEQCQSPQECGTCEFVQTVNNVIQFAVEISVLLAVLVFVWAGFLMVTSRGDTGQIQKAKGMFANVVIGLVILLAAFLIVNTILAGLLKSGSGVLNWQQIECVYPTESVEANLDLSSEKLTVPTSITTVSLGDDYGYIPIPTYSAGNGAGVCDPDYLTSWWGAEAGIAACVAQGESVCGADFYSTTDLDANDEPFSLGDWQINLTVHEIQGCAQYGAASDYLDCKAAYSGTNYDAVIINQALYDQCEAALRNVDCGTKNATRIRDREPYWNNWSAYGHNNCGAYAPTL